MDKDQNFDQIATLLNETNFIGRTIVLCSKSSLQNPCMIEKVKGLNLVGVMPNFVKFERT